MPFPAETVTPHSTIPQVKRNAAHCRPTSDSQVQIKNMIQKYSPGLDDKIMGSKPLPILHTVLLTGSTGNLGSQILELLLHDSRVERVYALNRPSSQGALAKHKEKFADKGLDSACLGLEKLTLLEGDTSAADLGLCSSLYEEIQNSVTVIIHTAWRLNFNLPLLAFESNIRGTRQLIKLGRNSPYGARVRFVFTSSTSIAFSWDTKIGPYPEEVVTDVRYAVGMGYGESKYVSERILSVCGLRATSLRIGQLSGGAPKGAWATTNWVPLAVKSSIALGALPAEAGTASWIPMDSAAQAILDITFTNSHDPDPALNIVHPQPIAFQKMMAHINDALISAGIIKSRLKIISQSEWTALIEERALSADQTSDIHQIPAIKILDFFRSAARADAAVRAGTLSGIDSSGLPMFSTAKAQAISNTMATMPPDRREKCEQLDCILAVIWALYPEACSRFFFFCHPIQFQTIL